MYINLIHDDLELIILVNAGIADFVYLFVDPDGTCTFGFVLVFGLESGRLWKKSLCIGFLYISSANLVVRFSLLSARDVRSHNLRACSYDTGLPLIL